MKQNPTSSPPDIPLEIDISDEDIRPKIIADEGSEADHQAVMHLFQSGHVPMGDGNNTIRRSL